MTDSVPWYQPSLADDIVFRKCDSSARAVQHVLDECRELRTPYVVITPAMREVTALRRIIVPVSRLEEEIYKAEICTYLARKTGAIVIASGETDYVADRTRLYEVKGGTAWMSRVTGTGCMLSSLLGAFLAVENSALSAAACCAMMNACAEKALAETVRRRGGTGTFHICLMDALSGSID